MGARVQDFISDEVAQTGGSFGCANRIPSSEQRGVARCSAPGGRLRVLRVVQGLGYGLDEQAVKAAEQIKFKPASQEGQRVDSTALGLHHF